MKLVITPWKQRLGVFGIEDNKLLEANIYDTKQNVCIGDIYLGRVHKILSNIKACFIQIGGKEDVFLPFDEMSDTIKTGDYIIIQIKKEASKGKQALPTTKISIAGLYCVLSAEQHSIEVSKKLSDEQRNYWKMSGKCTGVRN